MFLNLVRFSFHLTPWLCRQCMFTRWFFKPPAPFCSKWSLWDTHCPETTLINDTYKEVSTCDSRCTVFNCAIQDLKNPVNRNDLVSAFIPNYIIVSAIIAEYKKESDKIYTIILLQCRRNNTCAERKIIFYILSEQSMILRSTKKRYQQLFRALVSQYFGVVGTLTGVVLAVFDPLLDWVL